MDEKPRAYKARHARKDHHHLRIAFSLILALVLVTLTLVAASGGGQPAAAAVGDDPVAQQLAQARIELANCQILAAKGTTSAQRARGRACVTDQNLIISELLKVTTPPPTTTPPVTTRPPTSAPPTTTVPPTTTRPPVTTTTTVPPTTPPVTTPPPTTSPPAQTNNCMPVPHLCGFPDTTNTGTHGTLTALNSNVILSVPGEVLENRDVHGCITVKAANVVIRNVRVSCGGNYVIAINAGTGSDPWFAPNANTLIQDVEINHMGTVDGKGIAFEGYHANRVYYHNGADCFHVQRNILVENSYCVIGLDGGGDAFCTMSDAHWDGIQSDEGDVIVLRHNTIRNPCKQTSAILMSTNTLPIGHVTIEGNLMAGGGWTVYCGTGEGGPTFGPEIFRDNRISRSYYHWPPGTDHTSGDVGGYYGPMTSCNASNVQASNNRWDEDGTLIPIQ
jgi:hypothetical protein